MTKVDLEQLIKTRRSVSAFSTTPVPSTEIEELLETAVWVPNHRLTQPWRFEYYTNDAIAKVAAAAFPDKSGKKYEKLMSLPGILLVINTTHEDAGVALEDTEATAALTQTFALLAWANNIGTAWKTPGYINSDSFKTTLNIASNERVMALVHVGTPEGELKPGRERKPAADVFTVITK
ncbi:nitroreductase family protein [Brochothrix campestris]|uniref:Nitroreductase n=1 Tax=Brochothrix campestris FSL F6-1037 TaxID=1265861 RepID=W7D5I8_9LIST|nr:nitroreductase [Brochothrix campestris]EUJ40538.1 nitroreductase [Brochothrix campestris FSL F6-1037]